MNRYAWIWGNIVNEIRKFKRTVQIVWHYTSLNSYTRWRKKRKLCACGTNKERVTDNDGLIWHAVFNACSVCCAIAAVDFLPPAFLKSLWYLLTCSRVYQPLCPCQLSFPWHRWQPSSHTMIWLDSLCQIKEQQPWADRQTGMLQDSLDKYNSPQSRLKCRKRSCSCLCLTTFVQPRIITQVELYACWKC